MTYSKSSKKDTESLCVRESGDWLLHARVFVALCASLDWGAVLLFVEVS